MIQGFDEKNKRKKTKTIRVTQNKKDFNRSPYLVSTLGIYYLTH